MVDDILKQCPWAASSKGTLCYRSIVWTRGFGGPPVGRTNGKRQSQGCPPAPLFPPGLSLPSWPGNLARVHTRLLCRIPPPVTRGKMETLPGLPAAGHLCFMLSSYRTRREGHSHPIYNLSFSTGIEVTKNYVFTLIFLRLSHEFVYLTISPVLWVLGIPPSPYILLLDSRARTYFS